MSKATENQFKSYSKRLDTIFLQSKSCGSTGRPG